LPDFISRLAPTAENRWVGTNRGGFSNPEYDRLIEQFSTTLDRSQRGQLVADAMRVFTSDVAMISLYHNPGVVAFTSALKGPIVTSPETSRVWNVQQWEFRG
jgi:ABC-type transport system substrate-binding protein